jgi:hypothetical protein
LASASSRRSHRDVSPCAKLLIDLDDGGLGKLLPVFPGCHANAYGFLASSE